ncbi:MAG: TIGR02588 family protein [Cyanobacteria bacterium P01_D01_bin.1]
MSSSLKDKPESAQPESRSTAERVSFLIALTILLGIIVSVGYLWVSDRNQTPPVLEISTDSIEQRKSSYYVPFAITNLGGKTAATVQIVAELRIDNEIVESSEQTIDFLSREEEAEGAFIFTRNPSEGELTVKVTSYLDP